jgi:hypothetical protein
MTCANAAEEKEEMMSFDPFRGTEEGDTFCIMYELFAAEKYPLGFPSSDAQTREEYEAATAAEFAEFNEWRRSNTIAIRLAEIDKKELREAGFTHPSYFD